jgi:hypothetical protein
MVRHCDITIGISPAKFLAFARPPPLLRLGQNSILKVAQNMTTPPHPHPPPNGNVDALATSLPA